MTDQQLKDIRNEKLREWARGLLDIMAAVHFLIGCDAVPETYVMETPDGRVWLDFEQLDDDLRQGRLNYLSGGQFATLTLAASLANGELSDQLWRLDGTRKQAFAEAVTRYL